MASTLCDFDYKSTKADPDVWMRAKTKPDGFKYWSYILVYTDDLLVVDHEPQSIMDYMALRYTLKPGSAMEPESYLGAQVSKFYIDGSTDPEKPRWATSSEKYVKQAVASVETEMEKLINVFQPMWQLPCPRVTDWNWINCVNLMQKEGRTIKA
jgi:hypothetical protein